MIKDILKFLSLPFIAIYHLIKILIQSLLYCFKLSLYLLGKFLKIAFVFSLLIALFYGASLYFKGSTDNHKETPQKREETKAPKAGPDGPVPFRKDDYYFRTYRFSDHKKRRVVIEHGILKKHVEESEQTFGYSKKELYIVLSKEARNFQQKYSDKIKIMVNEDLTCKIRYKSDSAHLMDDFNHMYRLTQKSFYEKRMLSIEKNKIHPDFRAIQRWQADFLKTFYTKLRNLAQNNHMNEREFIIVIARFVQHLKYKVPSSPESKEIFGFWPPVVCLKEQAGDCDTKSTLFATIFYHYKKNSCTLILTKKHAFIGIKNQHKHFPKDRVLKIGGIDYLLLETTSVRKIGYISDDVLDQLKKRQFKYIHFY